MRAERGCRFDALEARDEAPTSDLLTEPIVSKGKRAVLLVLEYQHFELALALASLQAIALVRITGSRFDRHELEGTQAATCPLLSIFDVELTERVF